jgi:hypothetical protein
MAETTLLTALRALRETWRERAGDAFPEGAGMYACADDLDALLASVPHEDAPDVQRTDPQPEPDGKQETP